MPINEIFTEWIRYAQMDLDAALELSKLQRPLIEISCYHCQQSAEKILKAFLVFNNIHPEKTHDLDFLCSKCEKIDVSFSSLSVYATKLTDYVTLSRYPNKVDFGEYDMNQAIDFATKVFDFVVSKMQ